MNPNIIERVLKMKSVGMPDDVIAQRMELTTDQVRTIVVCAIQEIESSKKNGYVDLSAAFTKLCFQYQLLGESLKVVCGAMASSASVQEIKAVISNHPNPEAALLDNFIVLRKFTAPPTPEPKEN